MNAFIVLLKLIIGLINKEEVYKENTSSFILTKKIVDIVDIYK